ncbi:hypothetical protein NF27_DP00410 [Candidatus Jidaibacter acanthamoeba]|uniref:Uncharacterized protein n=1 Tax=Candidatus Jidaibacter acanthamoebae TaxID=86105 RepID=A0A0C1MTT1_9RICK|nr:hypothetical protein [Candidatus Jidaibacter acanthamoeba]KIE05497.1 hypothetical protein NF27_DP00410 [Candidatus Jidaibacter acanthamoeba]
MAEAKINENFNLAEENISSEQRDDHTYKNNYHLATAPVANIEPEYIVEIKIADVNELSFQKTSELFESSKAQLTIKEMMEDFDEKYGDNFQDSIDPEIHWELYEPC